MTTMTATEPTITKAVQAQTILQRAVCLTLECHYLGNNRKIDLKDFVDEAAPDRESGERDLAVDEDQFSATKHLIDRKELTPVTRVIGLAKAFLRAKAIPTPRVFGERSYLIPLASVEAVDAGLIGFEHELKKQAALLAYGRYDAAVNRQEAKLGPKLFLRSDYLAPSAVAAAFALDWSYVSFAAPDKLETVSAVLARTAQQKHTNRLAAAYDEVLLGLRSSALDVLRDLEARLTPGPDGKPKVLRGSTLRDLADFVAELPARNLTGDTALADALARVADRASGLDIQTLRDSDAVREALRASAAQASAVLAGLVETGRRGISLDGRI